MCASASAGDQDMLGGVVDQEEIAERDGAGDDSVAEAGLMAATCCGTARVNTSG